MNSLYFYELSKSSLFLLMSACNWLILLSNLRPMSSFSVSSRRASLNRCSDCLIASCFCCIAYSTSSLCFLSSFVDVTRAFFRRSDFLFRFSISNLSWELASSTLNICFFWFTNSSMVSFTFVSKGFWCCEDWSDWTTGGSAWGRAERALCFGASARVYDDWILVLTMSFAF